MKLPVSNLTFSCGLPFLSSGWRHLTSLLLFWLCLISLTLAQEKQWDKTFGGSEQDGISAMLPTPDGGYLLGGTSSSGIGGDKTEPIRGACVESEYGVFCPGDYWVVKLDASGNRQWDKTLGGDNVDELTALALTPDGGYLAGGASASWQSGDKSESKVSRPGNSEYWIVKLDGRGNKVWDKSYNGEGGDRGGTSKLTHILATADGGFLLAGWSGARIGNDKTEAPKGSYGHDYWLIKIDGNGNKQWDKTLGGMRNDYLQALIPTPEGGYLLGGHSESGTGGDKSEDNRDSCDRPVACTSDYWIVKVDSRGNKLWDKTFGGNSHEGLTAMVAMPDGGYLLGGSSYSGISGDKTEDAKGTAPISLGDYWVVKIDANGKKQWDKAFGGNGVDGLGSIQMTADGSYLLAGSSTSGMGEDKSEANLGVCSYKNYYYDCTADYWIVKIDSTGTKLWDKTLGGNKNDNLSALLVTGDGSYLLGGISDSDISSDKTQASRGKGDFWMIQFKDLNKKNQVIAFDILNKQVGDPAFPLQATSNSGLPVAFSIVSGPATITGNILTITGPGSVTVKAYQAGNETYLEAYLNRTFIVDKPSNISRVWQKTLGGSSDEGLTTLLATADGGYLLGGYSGSGTGGDKTAAQKDKCEPVGFNSEPYCPGDYWVVKLDGFGNKQWDKAYGGNGNDILQAMVATPDGGFLLGGSSYSEIGGDKSEAYRGNNDYWILKIDSNGNKLWDKTFGGGGYDDFQAIIATPDGGFLLGGSSNSEMGYEKSESNKGFYDYWIVKTDGNGTKLWDKTFGGTGFNSFSSMIATQDGGYLMTGWSNADLGGDKSQASRGSADYWVVKINAQGEKQWDKTFGGSSFDEGRVLAATSDGGYLLGGSSDSDISGDKTQPSKGANKNDYWLIRINSNGDKLWDKTLGGTQEEHLRSIAATSDGGFLVGGNSSSDIGADKTDAYRGEIFHNKNFDYWVVKVDGTGKILWDKTLGGSDSDDLTALVATGENSYLLGGYSISGLGGDKNEGSRGATDYWVVKIEATSAAPACMASGSILREQWDDIHGIRVVDILQDSIPTSTSLLSLFEGPSNIGEEYASRVRGYICAPQTGSYTFWIAGDNETQLWLSPDADPAHKVLIAGHPTWTQPRSWFESPSQHSAPVVLVAGQRYYIEALHKEGTIDDHLAVAWQLPDGTMEAPIPGSRLSPFEENTALRREIISLEKEPGAKEKVGLQVFPNPFFQTTTISFTPEADGEARLEILSLPGIFVQTVFKGKVKARTLMQYQVKGNHLAGGVYIARLSLNGKAYYRRMVLLR